MKRVLKYIPTGHYVRQSATIYLECRHCQTYFPAQAYRAKVAKFCSRQCAASERGRSISKENIVCAQCDSVFKNKYYQANPKFCSRLCCKLYQTKNRRNCLVCSTEFRATNIRNGNGRFCSMKCSGAYMIRHGTHKGNRNANWKGDDVGYSGSHYWVSRWRGKPGTCERCGKTGLKGEQIHWANKDHKYRRVLSDYIRLCATCHPKYDKERNLR